MKKLFTLFTAMLLLFGLSANAQSRKTWDFTKGVSDETRAMLDADNAQWTITMNSDQTATSTWTLKVMATGQLTAGDVVIPELAGLEFSNMTATNAVIIRGNCVRLAKGCTVTLPAIEAGHKVTIKTQSANATATDRGMTFTNAVIAEGPEDGIILGRDAEGAPEGGVTTFVLSTTGGAVSINTGLSGTPVAGVEILSIIIDEGDKNIKRWDFTNWSTKADICAATDWTKAETASKEYVTGDEIRWNLEPTYDANGDLTADGKAIPELKGLRHEGLAAYGLALAFDYTTTLDANAWGPYENPAYLWVTGANSRIIVPNVKVGSTLRLGVESHKLSEARGFSLLVDGAEIAAAQTSAPYAEVSYTVTGEGEYVDVALKATKGCHLYFIEAEVKDESVVDKNPSLGNPLFSIKDGDVISPKTEKLIITFPKAQNIEGATAVSIEGYLKAGDNDPQEFDGVEGSVVLGLEINFADFDEPLVEETSYQFAITKLVVDGFVNQTANEGEALYTINFTTKGGIIEEARSWNFKLTAEQAESIADAIRAGKSPWTAASKGRYQYSTPIKYKPLTTDGETEFSATEGLYFTMNSANDILIGTPAHNGVDDVTSKGGNNGRLQLGGGEPEIFIPSCAAGDEITIKGLWSTKNSGIITLTNAYFETIDAEGNPVQSNTVNLSGSSADYKIVVIDNDDVVLKSKNCVYEAIDIFPASAFKGNVKYTVAAQDADGNTIKVMAEGEVPANTQINGNFSFYLEKEGALYTAGSRGTPFTYSFSPLCDTTYVIKYKSLNPAGMVKAVYCEEAENLEGTMPVAGTNAPIRASNGQAVYTTTDITLTTLAAGTYKILAAVWDANKGGGGRSAIVRIGEEELEIFSTGDNMSEVTTVEFTVAEATPVVWVGLDDANHGLDAIVIYQYDAEKAEADGISSIFAENKTTAVYNLAGQKVGKDFKGIVIMNGKKIVK